MEKIHSAKGKARIRGMGSFLPERVLTNQDLEKMVDTSDEWIVSRTGMKERRIAGPSEFTSTMGKKASEKALKESGLPAESIDMVIVATTTPDYPCPSTAAIIQGELGAVNASAVDIQAACTGYLYGLSMAKAYVESGMCKNVLVVASEKMSSIVDYTNRDTCVLFGDGASAAVISHTGAGFSIDTVCLGADGSLADLLIIPAGGSRNSPTQQTIEQRMHFLKMEGKEVFKHAVRRMGAAGEECMRQANLKEDQISWIIPHQANLRIMDAIAKKFNTSLDKVYKTVHKYGNTSASSIPLALDELTQNEAISEGEHLLLVAFGAGLTWGAAILTKI